MKNPIEQLPPRLFVCQHRVLIEVTISPAMSAAYDLLEEYLVGPPPQQWLTLLAVAEKNGDDPVKLARKLAQFNYILRENRAT